MHFKGSKNMKYKKKHLEDECFTVMRKKWLQCMKPMNHFEIFSQIDKILLLLLFHVSNDYIAFEMAL